MSRTDFVAKVTKQWDDAFHSATAARPPASASWYSIEDIVDTLSYFMGNNLNHGHYPRGGGLDFLETQHSQEHGCIELRTADRIFDIVKPAKLYAEYISQSPRDSFLLLELHELLPTAVYKDSSEYGSEELVDLGQQVYKTRAIWDDGVSGFDDDGFEIPLPSHARLVTRWLRGKILIVAKGSLWNGAPSTYDGRHTNMTASSIRDIIEQAL